jgi:class 3 adenylate cyclase/predicted ATPase
MRCPSCNHDNPGDASFCEGCGANLELICPACKASVSPGARFCKKCGTAIGPTKAAASTTVSSPKSQIIVAADGAASEAIEGERKTVTALFADIKDSTEMMRDLDPEDARAIVDPALRIMVDAVRRYEGYVVQSTGDGIFALFGAPAAYEDHPQRALYAALQMQRELREYGQRRGAQGQPALEARIGVNTGEVVVRTVETGGKVEYTPIGHTVNLASRLQTVAPAGSIAVSEHTQKLVEGYFELRALGATQLKGVSDPVDVYEVTGLGPLRTHFELSARRGLTKFVGREREMEALKHAAVQAKGGRGQIVAAMAEPGAGKSRLFFEFKATSQSGWMVLETFSVSHGKASAYLPVIDLLRNYFDIAAGDDERKRREKVTGRVLALDRSLEDTLPYLFSLLGIVEGDDPLAQMDGQIKKRRTLEAIKRIVLRESLNHPLMVIFEDLHWIDGETQEFLNLLADSIGSAKVLLLVNYRPEYRHEWGNRTHYTQLRLDPLAAESGEEMLSALLGGGPDLQPLKRLIIERTEGNPFFMEEMVLVLFDQEALVRNGEVKLARPLSAIQIPPTAQGMLAARIDRLPAEQKELLQTLAVFGREFPLSLVHRVIKQSDDELNRMLSDLQLAEFIYEQPATGDIEYTFKHALTQEVAYNSVLIERRKLLHERAGVALESMFAEQLDDHLGELAHHYSCSDNLSKAVEYLGRAGQQALQRSAYADATSGLSTALNLLQRLPDSPERNQRELLLQLAVGPALIAVKGHAAPETGRAYTRAWELCERVGAPPELFPALFGLWYVYLVRGELRTAYELAESLRPRAQSAHEPAPLLYAQTALGITSFWMGELLPAREHFEVAISLYDGERHRPLAFRYGGADAGVNCLSNAAWILWQLGYPDQALKRGNEARALAQTLSHPFSLVFAEHFFGVLRQYRREARAAQESAEALIALCAEHGLAERLAWATSLRGWATAEQGRNEEGIAEIQEGLAASRARGAELYRPYFLTLLAEAHRETGHLDDGLSALTQALAAADEHEIRHYEAEMHRLKGELLLRQNNSNTAEVQSCFERAIGIARKQNARSFELRATMSLARLLASQGRRDDARAMLADIYNWFTEGFDTADLKDAKALLEEL